MTFEYASNIVCKRQGCSGSSVDCPNGKERIMATRTVREGNAFYEIDEDCRRRQEGRVKERKERTEDTEKKEWKKEREQET